jgi:hypothetical protein
LKWHYQDEDLASRVQQAATHARFWNHDAAALASMLGDLELVAPGVCEARNWMAGTGGEPTERPVYTLAAVGVKSRLSPGQGIHFVSISVNLAAVMSDI